jgi:hypothetical protein
LPYAFSFEVSAGRRLRVHGVIVPTSFDEDHIAAIDLALGKAGGKLKGSNIVRRVQSYLGALYDGHGWFACLQKTGDDAERFLGTHKVTFISTSLKKLCTADDYRQCIAISSLFFAGRIHPGDLVEDLFV